LIHPSAQSAYDIRFEWGSDGLAALVGASDAVVIVDVLSFSTSVDVAVGRGANALPFAETGDAARTFAAKAGAVCAEARRLDRYSLSPASLASVRPGERIVLPSPNGATLSLQTGNLQTFTACLRNATAVAKATARLGRRIAVIAAGERWPSGGLRPALEDWLGAGAVIRALDGRKSPEAEAACLAFDAAEPRLESILTECVSGQELAERGFAADVVIASKSEVSRCAPRLERAAFIDDRGPYAAAIRVETD
jgi:2-phosphosulfolactate phosphatase